MKKKILVLGHDFNELGVLKQALSGMSQDWESVFVSRSDMALDKIRNGNFDVVIADWDMPKDQGLLFLNSVKAMHPDLLRMFVTRVEDSSQSLRMSQIAHRYFPKKIEAGKIGELIGRSCLLQHLLHNEKMKKIIGSMNALPALPRAYMELNEALNDPETLLKDIAAIVEKDMALSAKVLQLVNSAYFGIPRQIQNIRNAVSFLGIRVIKNLALSIGVFQGFQMDEPGEFEPDHLQQHAVMTANIAMPLMVRPEEQEDAFAAGLLHDVGVLILGSRFPETFSKIVKMAREEKSSLAEAELEEMGVTHAQLGAYLLGIWGLPFSIVEAVAFHNNPLALESHHFDIVGAVHVANHLSMEWENKQFGDDYHLFSPLQETYLRQVGVFDKVDEWRHLVDDMYQPTPAQ